MVDAFRAQLDALMGVNRNGDTVRRALAFDLPLLCASDHARPRLHKQGGTTDYRDKSVCRYFLEGLCPCELFVNTVRKRHCVKGSRAVLLFAYTHTLLSGEHQPLDVAALYTH